MRKDYSTVNKGVYYTVWFYKNGEECGFNKFYTLAGAKAFINITTLDRAKSGIDNYKIVRNKV